MEKNTKMEMKIGLDGFEGECKKRSRGGENEGKVKGIRRGRGKRNLKGTKRGEMDYGERGSAQ